jgi:threonylcarbamoyladenosine tRNA methylthiotransferase MtaB
MIIALHTLGCKQNYAETSHIREQFIQEGHTIVRFGEPCDALIINTCTVTENADTECRKLIRRGLKISPKAFVGVTGCYAQLQPEEIASIDGVDAVFGAKEKFNIPSLVGSFNKRDVPEIFVDDTEDLEFIPATYSEHDTRTRAFLKMQDGCDYSCSFCTIPMARGGSRSMPFDMIESQLDRLVQAGFHEIILTGINLGEYKAPTGERLIDILKLVANLNVQIRFRLGSVEPNKVNQEIIELIANTPSICPHFHIPLQSGSPEILRQMKRRYKADYYADLVHSIKSAIPHAGIGADVITGFPSETSEQFDETYNFISKLPISYLHVFTYSERTNTPASIIDNKVPVSIRRQRTTQLRSLSYDKRYEFYKENIGEVRTVIPESYSPQTNSWSGYTENYIRAEFQAPPTYIQRPTLVRLDSIEGEIMRSVVLDNQPYQEFANETLPSYIPILIG